MGEYVGGQHSVGSALGGLGIHHALTAIRVKGNCDRLGSAPHAIRGIPVIGTASRSIVGYGVLFVSAYILAAVVKLGGGNGNSVVVGRVILVHVGVGVGASAVGQNEPARALAAGNIRAACGGIDCAVREQGPVYINSDIHQVVVGPGVGPGGRIGHPLEFGIGGVVSLGPLILVIDIERTALSNLNRCALSNIDH